MACLLQKFEAMFYVLAGSTYDMFKQYVPKDVTLKEDIEVTSERIFLLSHISCVAFFCKHVH